MERDDLTLKFTQNCGHFPSGAVFSELFLSKIYALFEVLENFPGNNLTGHIQRGHCNIWVKSVICQARTCVML